MSPAARGWLDALLGIALYFAVTAALEPAQAAIPDRFRTETNMHASTHRTIPTIKTVSGLYFPLLAPAPEHIRIGDIAHALSNLCRFTGHTRYFYSVAQHSFLASTLVPPEDALAALLHDASEAYIADISRPLKPHLSNYAEFETRIMEAVLKAFGLPTMLPPSVKRADMILLATEKRDLMMPDEDAVDWDCLAGVEPLNFQITPCAPAVAKFLFLDRFQEITGRTLP